MAKLKEGKDIKHLRTLIIQKRKLKHKSSKNLDLEKLGPGFAHGPWCPMCVDTYLHFPKDHIFQLFSFKVILFICHIFRLLSSRNWPIPFIFFCDVPKVYRSSNIIYQGQKHQCLVFWLHGCFLDPLMVPLKKFS